VHAGETGGADEVRDAVEALEPTRIGHGIKSALDPDVMALLRERQIVLEICPSSNLSTQVVRDLREVRRLLRLLIANEVPFAISTDGPEMLRSYLRDELNMLLRNEILGLDEVHRALEIAHRASFVDRAPVREPARLPLRHLGDEADAPFSVEVGV
jgi:adenosine deaminase